ncbi:hypothetical protein SC499_15595 [Peribacillus simplex]|uniref:hypothetical protein n=1 Tax=Peribacillus simplex TaxID=1478 RepID=UPI00298DC7BA|nr:hypothetical protein [Peribacillus simplex]MDW7616109.1 hypothetical protein [Peribacillus simplex]
MSDIDIGNYEGGQLTPAEDFNVSSMLLRNKDREGKRHTETNIGYFENGYVGEAAITL